MKPGGKLDGEADVLGAGVAGRTKQEGRGQQVGTGVQPWQTVEMSGMPASSRTGEKELEKGHF